MSAEKGCRGGMFVVHFFGKVGWGEWRFMTGWVQTSAYREH